jgi:DNA-binding response OmpR family regulator
MARVLLADDDRSVQVMLSSWLRLEDQHTVDTAADGEEALGYLTAYKYDVVVLDWEMPKMTGVEVCRRFKEKHPMTPVLMLTGKDTSSDKIQGLDAGADDYITKPFSAEELSARLRALMRRRPAPVSDLLISGKLSLDCTGRSATAEGKSIHLSPIEFNLLEFFLRHPREEFLPEALLSRVWGDAEDATVASVRTTINRLRGKVEEALGTCPLSTRRGSGYYWESSP